MKDLDLTMLRWSPEPVWLIMLLLIVPKLPMQRINTPAYAVWVEIFLLVTHYILFYSQTSYGTAVKCVPFFEGSVLQHSLSQ